MRRLLLAAFAALALLAPSAASAALTCPIPGASILGVRQSGGLNCTTVQGCVNQIPRNMAGNWCVVFDDKASYFERVEVAGINNNGFRIYIGTVTAGTVRPTLFGVLSSTVGVFHVGVPSVTVEGMNFWPFDDPYGVHVTSAYVTISSVGVSDSASGTLSIAGIKLSSSYATVAHSSVTVAHTADTSAIEISAPGVNNQIRQTTATVKIAGNGNALLLVDTSSNSVTDSYLYAEEDALWMIRSHLNSVSLSTAFAGPSDEGLAMVLYSASSNTLTGSRLHSPDNDALWIIAGSTANVVSLSTLTTSVAGGAAVFVTDAKSNLITTSFLDSELGLAVWLDAGAARNTVSFSHLFSNGASYAALRFDTAAASNTVTDSFIESPSGLAIGIYDGSHDNYITRSTASSNNTDWPTYYVNASASNTLTHSVILNESGDAATIEGASDLNSIRFSTIISDGSGTQALFINGSSSVTVANSYLEQVDGGGPLILNAALYATISGSTIAANSPANPAVLVTGASSSNTFSSSLITNVAGTGLQFTALSNYNAVAQSTMIGGAAGQRALYILNSQYNTVSGSVMRGSPGHGLTLGQDARFNVVLKSTMTTSSAGDFGLYVLNAASNTVVDSYVQGSTAAVVSGSTGTVIGNTMMAAVDPAGAALTVRNVSVNLSVTSSTLRGRSVGLDLQTGSRGFFSITTNTVMSADTGVRAGTQGGGAGFDLFLSSLTFRGMNTNATGIHFLAGSPVSTITLADFGDSSILINVAAPNIVGGRITMRADNGMRTGPTYENDPNGVVDWPEHFPGCSVTRRVGGGFPFATIQSAVNSLPLSLPGHSCVIVESVGPFGEQVNVDGFTMNGASITIRPRADSGPRPSIRPPASSTAAFRISNASVNVSGFDILTLNDISYGIYASSAYVNISSISVSTNGISGVTEAGIRVVSWSRIDNATVTVYGAHGVWSEFSDHVTVNDARFIVGSFATEYGLFFNSVDSATVTNGFIVNSSGTAARIADSDVGAISLSTMSGTLDGHYGVHMTNSDMQSMTSVVIQNPAGGAARFNDVDYGGIAQSTIAAGGVLSTHHGVEYGNTSILNTVTGTRISAMQGHAVTFVTGSNSNTITQSSVSVGALGGYALDFTGTDSNTVSQSYVSNQFREAVRFSGGADFNLISQSTVTSSSGFPVISVIASDSNTVSGSRVLNLAGTGAGVAISGGADHNRFEYGTLTVDNAVSPAYSVSAASGNVMTGSTVQNLSGPVIRLVSGSLNRIEDVSAVGGSSNTLQMHSASTNTISHSTFTANAGVPTVYLAYGSNNNLIEYSRIVAFNSAFNSRALRIVASAENRISGSFIISPFAAGAIHLMGGAPFTRIEGSTATADSGSQNALANEGNSNLTLSDSYFQNINSVAVNLSDTQFAAVERSTFVGGSGGIFLSNSSTNVFTGSVFVGTNAFSGIGMQMSAVSHFNQVSLSSFSGGLAGLLMDDASSGTITTSFFSGYTHGLMLNTNAHNNVVSFSTAVSLSAASATVNMEGAATHMNLFTNGYVQNRGVGDAVRIQGGAFANTVAQSTLYMQTAGGVPTFHVAGASNTLSDSFVYNPGGMGVLVNIGASRTVIARSTITASVLGLPGHPAIRLQQAADTWIVDSYVQGSSAVVITGSSDTFIGGSVLISTRVSAAALASSQTAMNLTVSSSILRAVEGTALMLVANKGMTDLSTNTIEGQFAGANIEAYGTTPYQLWMASNTVLPRALTGQHTYGILLNGLHNGGQLRNNAVYYRSLGVPTGGSGSAQGVEIRFSNAVTFERNRINMPGALDSGGSGNHYAGIRLRGSVGTTIRYNDVHSSVTVNSGSAYGLRVGNASANVSLRNNIFSSSFSVSATTAMVFVETGSETGFSADYNDYHSSNSVLTFQWLAFNRQGLSAWNTASGQDAQSISGNPLWHSVKPGTEDFHPHSIVGRYDPTVPGFVLDADASPTIDAGDAAPTNEPHPFGAKVNQGSYGDTSEASKTGQPFPGCAVTRNVGAGQLYATIQAGVNALPPSLPGHACVVIEDANVYPENVVVANIATNGSSITIRQRGDSDVRPTLLTAGGSTAGFLIQNASVNIAGINVQAGVGIPYGIHASSGWVTISSVNVGASGPFFTAAGIRISSWSTVSHSSVVMSGVTHGIWLDSTAERSTVRFSTAINNSGSQHAVFLDGASSNTLTSVRAHNGAGEAVRVGGNHNIVSFSTVTGGAVGGVAFQIAGFSSNSIVGSDITSADGHALWLNTGSDNNQVALSTVSATGSYAALRISSSRMNVFSGLQVSGSTAESIESSGSDYNTFSAVYASNVNGTALRLAGGSDYNQVAGSTFTSSAGFAAVYVLNSDSNVITGSRFHANSGTALFFQSGSDLNDVSYSTVTTLTGAVALTLDASSFNDFADIYAENPGFYALNAVGGANGNIIARSTFVSNSNTAPAMRFVASSSTTLDRVTAINGMGRAAEFTGGSSYNTISLSSFNGAGSALYLQSSSASVISGVYAVSSAADGIFLDTGADWNVVSLSTVASSHSNQSALYMSGASSNAFNHSYFGNVAGGRIVRLETASNHNSFSGSTIAASVGSAFPALALSQSSSNTFTGSYVSNPVMPAAEFLNNSNSNAVVLTTITARQDRALRVDDSNGTRIEASYLQGLRALHNMSADGTSVFASVLVATTPAGGSQCAVYTESGVGFSLSSSSVTSMDSGVCLDSANNGLLNVSSNTIFARAYGLHARFQSAGAQVIVSSNVILPRPGSIDGGGIFVDGLTTGGTFYNNSIYYRSPGGMLGMTQTGIRVSNGAALLIARNRINMPGMLTTGNFDGMSFTNTSSPGISVLNNDVHVITHGGLSTVNLLRTVSPVGGTLHVKNNIFSSSATAVSTYTVQMSGFQVNFNYNVFHSSTGPLYFTDGVNRVGLPAWTSATGQDAGSTDGHPRWQSTAPDAEDFHVKSVTGRYDPGTQAFVTTDLVDSASLDAGDPTESFAGEPAPNGFHANAGSTGGTAEASKSPPQACAVLRKVCKTGGCAFSSIQAAINSIPNPLVGYSCVSIRDTAVYQEPGLVVAGFDLNGSSISIAADPAFSTGAILRATSLGFALLDIRVASVTVSGLDFQPNALSHSYGVRVSSPNVVLSRIRVEDPGAWISAAGIEISTETTISRSTIILSGLNSPALASTGSHVRISEVFMSWSGTPTGTPLFVMKDSYGSVVSSVQVNANGSRPAVRFSDVSNTSVARATFTTSSGDYALSIATGANLSFDDLVLTNGNWKALELNELSSGVTIDRGSFTASAPGVPSVWLRGSGHVLSNSRVGAVSGFYPAIEVNGSAVRLSSLTVTAQGTAVAVIHSTGVVIAGSRFQGGLGSPSGYGLHISSGGGGHEVLDSTVTTNATAATKAFLLDSVSSNTVSRVYIAGSSSSDAFYLSQTSGNYVSQSTVIVTALGGNGVYLLGASSNVFTGLFVSATDSHGLYFAAGSDGNLVDRATVTARGAGRVAIGFSGASSNTVSHAVIISTGYRAVEHLAGAASNSVALSSIATTGPNQTAVYVQGSSSFTVSESYVGSPAGSAIQLDTLSGYNTVSLSTAVSGSPTLSAFTMFSSSHNLIDRSVVLSTAGSRAVQIFSGASHNLIDQSLLVSGFTGGIALRIDMSSNVVSRSFIRGSSEGVRMTGDENSVLLSTVVGGQIGVHASLGFRQEVAGSYVQASTAVYVENASSPSVNGSRLAGLATTGLYITNSSALQFSSNVVTGGSQSGGLYVGPGNGGIIRVSTNVFLSSARAGVYAETLTTGSQLWISSNVFFPTVGLTTSTYGVYLQSLNNGATVQNNNFYYHASGAMAAASLTTYGVFADNSAGVMVDHNRYSNSGMVTTGGAIAFHFQNSPNATVAYNDVHMSETGASPRSLVSFGDSPNSVVTGNILVNKRSSSGDSVILDLADAASQTGFRSDYNDLLAEGPNAYVGTWGAFSELPFSSWQLLSARDASSISENPLWFSTAPASEDFHPLSAAAGGRFVLATGLRTQDAVSSLTIDRADPAASPGAEENPGGARANMGSYGQTVEASRAAPPPGCGVEFTVANSGVGVYSTIAAALAAVPATLTTDTCIVVRRRPSNVINLNITGKNTAANNKRLIIMGEPGVPTHVNSGGSAIAPFHVNNDSVTIKDLTINTNAFHQYGIQATGAYVHITSVVIAGPSLVTAAGFSISSHSVVSYSSVTSAGRGIEMVGSGASVLHSTVVTVGGSSGYALDVLGASSPTISNVYAAAPAAAVYIGSGTIGAAVSGSTFVTSGFGTAFVVAASSRGLVSGSVIRAPDGSGIRFEAGAYDNTVMLSTVASSEDGYPAIVFVGAASNTVTRSYVDANAAARTVTFTGGARLNTVSHMSLTGHSPQYLVEAVGASSNTLSDLSIYNSAGTGVAFLANAHYNSIVRSSITTVSNSGHVLRVDASSGTRVLDSYLANSHAAGYGIEATGANHLLVDGSTIVTQGAGMTGYYVDSSSYTTLTRSVVRHEASGWGARLTNSHGGRIDGSTVSAVVSANAVLFTNGRDNAVTGSYVEGSEGIALNAALRSTVHGSYVRAASNALNALVMLGGSNGLTASSNTFVGGPQAAGVRIDENNTGTILIASNTFAAAPLSARYGVYVGTQSAGAKVVIASNTIIPATSVADSLGRTMGIHLNGLRTGATIQNNSVYYRNSGAMTGEMSFGVYLLSSEGVVIERNRVSNPNMITAGGNVGIGIEGSAHVTVRSNDVYLKTTFSLTNGAHPFAMLTSSGAHIANSVFSGDMTGTSSSTVYMDAYSASAGDFQNNLFFSSNSLNILQVGNVRFQYPWGNGIDVNAVSFDPQWPSLVAGAEDFHPRSHAGRFNPATGLHDINDIWTSGTIDRADSSVPFASEPGNNGGQGNLGSYGGTPEASITPAAPANPVFAAVNASSVTVAYDPAPGAPRYLVSASTSSNFSATIVSSMSSNGVVLALTPSPLLSNTTYHFAVAALWGDAYVQAGNSFSTVTLAFIPAPASVVSFPTVGFTTATAAWQPNGNPLNQTTYTVTFTTSAAFPNANAGNRTVTRLADALTPDASAFITALAPNTTYFAHVAALNHLGAVSAYLPLGSTATRANTPLFLGLSATYSSVTDQTLLVSWGANGNPVAITSYTVEASTDSSFSFTAASITTRVMPPGLPSTTLTGLTPAATYFLRVAAINGDGQLTPYELLGSTVMLPLQIFPPVVVPGVAHTTHSLTATWGLVGNATGYTLYASTMPANPPVDVWASSSTFGQAATTATVSTPPLAPNTTYYLFVRAHGFTSNSTYAAYAATATSPAEPLSAPSTFTAVQITSFTVNWLANGNPLAMTTYTVVASTASDFNSGASSVTFSTVPAFGPTATLTGLGAYATYYVGVRALGQGITQSAFVVLGATQTLPIFLPAPVATATGVSASSMSAAWQLTAGATGYTLVASYANTNPPAGVVASSVVAGVNTTSASVFGLLSNTTHFLFIRADGPGNSSAYALYAATATDPNAPPAAATLFTGVTNAAAGVNWTAGGNPITTTYTVTMSTTAAFPNTSAGNVTSTTAAFGLTMASLSPNTTYFAAVAALSNGGVSFGGVLGSTATLANAPLAAVASTFSMVGVTSVTINWQANSNPNVTTYTVVASTASDFNVFATSVSLTSAPAAGPTVTFTGLAFGTSWYFQARAINHNGVPTAFTTLGSTYTQLSNVIPLISDFQGGDDTWRRDETTGVYDIRFVDASGTNLDRVQVRVSTMPGGLDTAVVPFTNVLTGLSGFSSYSTPFPLTAAVFNAMQESATNYVTVSVYNGVSSNTLVDAFYVRKDTTLPVLVNGEAGGDHVVQTAAGRAYAVTARDLASGLDLFQYSVSETAGTGDGLVLPWTDIAPLSGATDYTTPWTLNFALLKDAATNYVSVRAVDLAGNTSTYLDAFRVFKDTMGPTVTISTPNAGTGFVSGVPVVQGGATGVFGVKGTEVAIQNNPPAGLYWDPVGGSFSSAGPAWMAAVGVSSWTFNPPNPFANGTSYRIVARSSTTYGMYSTVYATAAFTLDTATPTVAVTWPPALATVSSLPHITGTAADPGGAPSGVAVIEVRLRRLSTGLWWNWFTNQWQVTAVSTTSAGPAVWNVTASQQLQSEMVSGASFYVAVRASDAALPANSGDFFAQGSTFTFSNAAPPDAISDLAGVNGPLPGEISLSWTAQGPHGSTGTTLLGQYAVFTATYGAAPASTSAAVVFATSSVTGGDLQFYRVTGLTSGVTYFLSVAMANTDGTWSAFSNVASTTATPAPSNSILGHVVNASTQGITAVRLDAFDSTGLLVATAFTLADGSGTFSVNGLTPGNYKVEASWTANGVTSSVWQDGIAMGSVNIDFSLDINYALATLTGTLGALTSSGPAGLGVAGSGFRPSMEGSHVELHQGGREVARATADPTGRWTIGHLLPGSYSVRAYTGTGYTDFVDVDLLEGEIRTVGFVFNPLPDATVFAFPNPARHSTTIRFETALQPLEAQIAIFDLKGALVREVPGSLITATATPGLYHYVWDLTNSRGTPVASGVYLFMVKVKGGSENQLVKVIKKLAVVR